MIPDKETRDIQAYLRDTLPKSRRDKFEARLQNDPNLRAKVDELRPIFETLEETRTAEKIREIIESNEETQEEKKIETKIKPLLWWRAGYAAAACILFLIGVFIRDSTIDLRTFNDVYHPSAGVSRGETVDVCPDLAVMKIYYQGEDVNGAYQSVIDTLAKKPQGPCITFYEGMSYLGLGDASKAIPFLLNSTKSADTELRQNAEWYLSIAYIRNHDKDKAKDQLEKIIESKEEHRFKNHAENLISELGKEPLLFNFQF